MDKNIAAIEKKLRALADEEYAVFLRGLLPTVAPESVIGVRMPELRQLGKEFTADEARAILSYLPHRYHEEYLLHGIVINGMRDIEQALAALDELLPYVSNWAVCDLLRPRVRKADLPRLWEKAPEWLGSPLTYTKRFGLSALMNFFLTPPWTEQALALAATVSTDEYYVEMMAAWLYATALAKDWDQTLPYLQQGRLAPWTHNKAIQKARESRRITPGQKEYLQTLKVECPPEQRIRREDGQ